MKINKLDSKKYFVESVLSALPQEYRNKPLVKKALIILKSKIPPIKTPFVIKRRDLAPSAWKELTTLLKGKKKLDPNQMAYVKFIEQEIFNIACGRESGEEEKLLDYRQPSLIGIANTCCYLCGSVLERHTAKKNLHFCTEKENPSCYKNRKSSNIKENRSWKFFLNKKGVFRKPYCAMCNKLVTFSMDKKNYFYKELVFCNQRHVETYRKRELRNQNKLKILTSKIP